MIQGIQTSIKAYAHNGKNGTLHNVIEIDARKDEDYLVAKNDDSSSQCLTERIKHCFLSKENGMSVMEYLGGKCNCIHIPDSRYETTDKAISDIYFEVLSTFITLDNYYFNAKSSEGKKHKPKIVTSNPELIRYITAAGMYNNFEWAGTLAKL